MTGTADEPDRPTPTAVGSSDGPGASGRAATGLVAPPAAQTLFGDRLGLTERYAHFLATAGVERGLLGPREVPRIWDRHLLNCAVVEELIPASAAVLDVGSGAGLPGVPLALARPDLSMTLVEPLDRRATFLHEAVTDIAPPISVVRARAEDVALTASVVTARALAPLHRLLGWCLPLVAPGGLLLAIKGRSATEEVARDAAVLRRAGAEVTDVVTCGSGLVAVPTTVVVIRRRP